MGDVEAPWTKYFIEKKKRNFPNRHQKPYSVSGPRGGQTPLYKEIKKRADQGMLGD